MLYQFRNLLALVWIAQLAWMCAPAAADDQGTDLSSYRAYSPDGSSHCGNSWAADNCGVTASSLNNDERGAPQRVKVRDIAKSIVENFAGDELELLRLKQRANFKPYARQLGISKLDFDLSMMSHGSQMRLHTTDTDQLAVSLRGASDDNTDDTTVGINMHIRW